MPQIDTPDNFDFSKDQHKLALVEDLKRLARLVGNLGERADGLETTRLIPSLLSSTLSPYVPPTTLTYGQVIMNGSDGVTLAGDWGSGTLGSISAGTYQQSGSATVRGSYSIALSSGTGLLVILNLALPRNITGWGVSGIEWDNKVTGAVGTQTVTLTAIFGDGSSSGVTATHSDVGVNTAWTTARIKGGDLISGFARQPETRLQLQFSASVGTGPLAFHLGQLRLNWN